uniref:Uncharacterized protein n=1 Tax=Glossina austeni TaxID=7395 RepID=A0A1A9V7N8_GLOAU
MSTSIGYVAYSKSGSYRGLKVAITSHVVGGGGGGGGYGGGYGGGLFCTTTMLCYAMLCYAMLCILHPLSSPHVIHCLSHFAFNSYYETSRCHTLMYEKPTKATASAASSSSLWLFREQETENW